MHHASFGFKRVRVARPLQPTLAFKPGHGPSRFSKGSHFTGATGVKPTASSPGPFPSPFARAVDLVPFGPLREPQVHDDSYDLLETKIQSVGNSTVCSPVPSSRVRIGTRFPAFLSERLCVGVVDPGNRVGKAARVLNTWLKHPGKRVDVSRVYGLCFSWREVAVYEFFLHRAKNREGIEPSAV